MSASLLTRKQAAAQLGVSEATVKRLNNDGSLPVVPVGKRGKRIRPEDVDRYINDQVVPDPEIIVIGY